MSKNQKNILKHFISGTILLMIFVVPVLVLGQGGPSNTQGKSGGTDTQPVKMNIKIINPFKHETIPGLINTIIDDILIPVGSVIAVLMVMWAGFKYVTARGDTTQIKEARDALLGAVIGAAILLGARILSDAIGRTIDQLK